MAKTVRCISFSGGRSSAYMLWLLIQENLQTHGVPLLETDFVVFANTGKEREETLQFVHDCETHWGIKIHWIERFAYVTINKRIRRRILKQAEALTGPAKERLTAYADTAYHIGNDYILTSFETADRWGRPFEALIDEKGMPPNVMARFCTDYLKVKPIEAFMRRQLEILNHRKQYEGTDYEMLIGFRHDEPLRVAKKKAANDKENQPYLYRMPLNAAKVTKADVDAFWSAQPFDLQLKSYQGNCDLCFLKGRGKLAQLLRENPAAGDWWIMMETYHEGTFRKGHSYLRMKQAALVPQLFGPADLEADDDLTASCVCGD